MPLKLVYTGRYTGRHTHSHVHTVVRAPVHTLSPCRLYASLRQYEPTFATLISISTCKLLHPETCVLIRTVALHMLFVDDAIQFYRIIRVQPTVYANPVVGENLLAFKVSLLTSLRVAWHLIHDTKSRYIVIGGHHRLHWYTYLYGSEATILQVIDCQQSMTISSGRLSTVNSRWGSICQRIVDDLLGISWKLRGYFQQLYNLQLHSWKFHETTKPRKHILYNRQKAVGSLRKGKDSDQGEGFQKLN